MTTRSRSRVQLATPTLITLLTLFTLCSTTNATSIPDTKCPEDSTFTTKLLYVTPCETSGIGIAHVHSPDSGHNFICWIHLYCPSGHLQPLSIDRPPNSNNCGERCHCPPWTKQCSSYNGLARNSSTLSHLPSELQGYVPPDVCSFDTQSSHCSSEQRLGIFNQVQLFDGTLLVVKDLTITITDVFSIDDHRCFFANNGSPTSTFPQGSVTGTSQFCTYHTCVTSSTATVFCFYAERVASLVFHDFKIPISAWGTIRRAYYPHLPQTAPPTTDPPATCTIGGLTLLQTAGQRSIQLCSEGFCTFVPDIRQISSTIFLPASVVTQPYTIQLTTWDDGKIGTDYTLRCPANPLCSTIDCKLCLQFVKNWTCWSYLDYAIAAIGILAAGYLAAVLHLVLLMMKAGSIVFNILRRCTKFIFHLIRSIFLMPFRFLRRRPPPNPTLQALRARYIHHLAIACALLLPSIHACAEVTSLSVKEHSCIRTNASLECTIHGNYCPHRLAHRDSQHHMQHLLRGRRDRLCTQRQSVQPQGNLRTHPRHPQFE